MKTMFLVAAAVLALGVGSAFAQGTAGGYAYPNFWGNQAAQAAPQARAAAPSNGDTVSTFVTHSTNAGTWLFPPNPNNGG